tara:strand:- start:940 stop:1122 length:183 start_codon:yes stop_codon:yes gene_type:complete
MKLSRIEWCEKCDVSAIKTVFKQRNMFKKLVVPILIVVLFIFSVWIAYYVLSHEYHSLGY